MLPVPVLISVGNKCIFVNKTDVKNTSVCVMNNKNLIIMYVGV